MHTPSVFSRRARRAAAVAAFAVLLAACGGDSTTTTNATAAPAASGDATSGDASTDPEAVAEANTPLLQPSDSVQNVEVLDVSDGSISTLAEAADGDRPVLLWFFSPH